MLGGFFKKPEPPAPPPLPTPRLDSFAGDPELREAKASLLSGQWQVAERLLESTADPNRRANRISVLAEAKGRPPCYDEWVDRTPGRPLGLLVRGAHSIQWAWEARGEGNASTVSKEGWRLFYERLHSASEDLVRAGELDPADAISWGFRIVCATGLGDDQIVRTTVFEQARRRYPELRMAYDTTLMGLLKKWGGSHEAAFDFARSASRSAKPGSPLHTLVADAHIERWLYFTAFEEDSDAGFAYMASDAVRQELRKVHTLRFPPGGPKDSHTIGDRNTFAFAFYVSDEWALALEEFRKIGPNATEAPWYFLSGGSLAAFTRARTNCLGGPAKK